MDVNEFWIIEKKKKIILKIQENLKKKGIHPIKNISNFIRRMEKGDAVMRIDAYNQIAQIYGTREFDNVTS